MKIKIINSPSLEYLKNKINNEIQDSYRWIEQIQREILDTQKCDQTQERIANLRCQLADYRNRIQTCRGILIQIDEQTSEIEI